MIRFTALISALLLSSGLATAGPAETFSESCASCHGEDRLGGTGPALIPQTLKRMRGPNLEKVILNGRPATQMPAFADVYSAEEIKALAAYIKEPLDIVPEWGEDKIAETLTLNEDYVPASKPVFSADPMNITLVVET
ncbi:MAG: cytochrome c, partial [Roseibium sp.]|nr:cytochrome c [Roseibium sp.]